jgi:ABC-type nickel/cobalt efflux system permease component RcnA
MNSLIAVALCILVISSGVHLLALNKHHEAEKAIKVWAYFIIIAGFIILICSVIFSVWKIKAYGQYFVPHNNNQYKHYRMKHSGDYHRECQGQQQGCYYDNSCVTSHKEGCLRTKVCCSVLDSLQKK